LAAVALVAQQVTLKVLLVITHLLLAGRCQSHQPLVVVVVHLTLRLDCQAALVVVVLVVLASVLLAVLEPLTKDMLAVQLLVLGLPMALVVAVQGRLENPLLGAMVVMVLPHLSQVLP
jgi:hypothetical protein